MGLNGELVKLVDGKVAAAWLSSGFAAAMAWIFFGYNVHQMSTREEKW